MHLSKLILENFRSYSRTELEFDSKINLILGPNGAGKTNVLESIYFLSCGKSFRSSALSQLINWDKPFTSVIGKLLKDGESVDLEVQLIKDPAKVSLSRKFMVNQVGVTRPKYLGVLKTVVFEPEDIRLVTGSPGRRRDYLDSVFTSTEWRYAQALSQYHRALKHRNELLDLIRLGRSQRSELYYWDQSLIKNSGIVHTFRQSFVRSLNTFFKNHPFSEIQTLSINYRPSILTEDRLEKNYSFDLNCGYTQAGIHRDDFSFDNSIFSATDQNLAFWGSRGQQRLAVLALRLGQINYLEESYSQKPILLLDDIFSELDPEHRQLVVDICRKYQTIFTSAEESVVSILPDSHILHLSAAF